MYDLATGDARVQSPEPLKYAQLLFSCVSGHGSLNVVAMIGISISPGPVRPTPTLSCKSRLTRRAAVRRDGCRTRRRGRRKRDAADATPCSSEPPEAAPPPGQRTGGFCQLVRGVGRRPRLVTRHLDYGKGDSQHRGH